MTARLATAGAAVAALAFGFAFGAASQERPLVLGVWLPAARAVPDPLPLTDAARRAAPEAVPPGDAPKAEPVAEPAAAALAAAPCSAPGMPALLDTRGAVEITQERDRIRMTYVEWSGAARTIYMNPRNGPATQEPSPLGVSFGRWESRTLAIFTTYIAYPYFDRARTPQSAAVTVLERYTPSADGTRLEWKATVTDAATFTAPVVITGAMAAHAAPSDAPAAAPNARDDAAASSTPTAEPLVASGCVG